jgi:signal transduction histidine kinase
MEARPTAFERVRRVDPRIWDAVIAAAVLVILESTVWLERNVGNASVGSRPVAAVVVLIASVSLYWRRKQPLAVILVVSAAGAVFATLHERPSQGIFAIPLVLAAYACGAYLPRSAWQAGGVIAAFAVGVALLSDAHTGPVERGVNALLTIGIPFAFGRIVWNRRRRIERDRDLAASEAVAVERGRIGRELHDVVAHSMSVMVVQAGAARSVLRKDPAEAERALRSIEESGRIGLAEMRRLLATEGDGAPELAPQPGLARLPELLEQMRAAGLAVELVVEGDPRAVPVGMDLSAYRIVQEALTNVLKHAGDNVHARVLLRYSAAELTVEVDDDGNGPASTDGVGRGLIGMRERVALFGGDLTSGARPGGGFRVRAGIPLRSEEPQ